MKDKYYFMGLTIIVIIGFLVITLGAMKMADDIFFSEPYDNMETKSGSVDPPTYNMPPPTPPKEIMIETKRKLYD